MTKKKCNGFLVTDFVASLLLENDLTDEEYRSLWRLMADVSKASAGEKEDENTARAHERIIKTWLADIRGGLVQ
jgi:hypothetical protein